jgi:hypothetical protein
MRKLIFVLASLMFCPIAVLAADKPAAPASAPLKGVVLEVRDVETYTYLRLKTKDGETWAAVPKATIRKGAEVSIENTMLMTNFESRSLKKTFDKIVFGSLAGADGNTGTANPHAGLATRAAITDVKVPKATGADARTVAEIVRGKDTLKNKTVAVRGTVVKYTPKVLGRNWIHLRDGSGSASDGTDDVLVTTRESAAVGDVVIARGIVQTDKDFGSGYAYKVLVDDARLGK